MKKEGIKDRIITKEIERINRLRANRRLNDRMKDDNEKRWNKTEI